MIYSGASINDHDTSEEQPHAIERPRAQVRIETIHNDFNVYKATSQERPPLYSV